jgi:hypothetical protein
VRSWFSTTMAMCLTSGRASERARRARLLSFHDDTGSDIFRAQMKVRRSWLEVEAFVWAAGWISVVIVLPGCLATHAAGVAVGVARLTSKCHDPVEVSVVDSRTGRGLCDSSVVARRSDGVEVTFAPCFRAELDAGTWTVSASRRGYQAATSQVTVEEAEDCEPALQSLELSLHAGSSPEGISKPL